MKKNVKNIASGIHCLAACAGWLTVAILMAPIVSPAAASGFDFKQVDVRERAREAALTEMDRKYGRTSEARMHRIESQELNGRERRVTGDGTYLVGKDRREFSFECFVDERTGVVRGLKIRGSDVALDVRELGIEAALAEITSRHGRESRPSGVKVYSADFSKHEKRVYGNGIFKLNGRQQTFTFECIVHMYTGQVRNMKIEEKVDRDERSGRPGRPGFGDRPGSDRGGVISDRRAREYAETAVLDRLRTDGVSGTVNITESRIVETVRGQSRIEGEGNYRSTGREHRFTFTCSVDMKTGRVDRLKITE